MSTSGIIEKVKATIREHRMLIGAGRVLIAVSGGPDSLALLHLLAEISATDWTNIDLHAGHLHHGMRGLAADEDAAFVVNQCDQIGIACTVKQTDVPLMAKENGVGEEEAGRNARYSFLTQLASSINANRIAFGHHADDQSETVLMRVMRGAGPRGMCGIPHVRPAARNSNIKIIRPLLDCWRSDVEAFLKTTALKPRLDETNLSDKYLRNRLRQTIMPAMETNWGSKLRADLCETAIQANRLRSRLRDILLTVQGQQQVHIQNEYVEVNSIWLSRMPPSVVAELVQHWMQKAGLSQRTPTSTHYKAIAKLLADGNGTTVLPGNVEACCSESRFALRRAPKEPTREMVVTLDVPGSTKIECLGARIDAAIVEGGYEKINDGGNMYEEFIDLDKVTFPLQARFRRVGDRMKPLGAPGTRRLKKIMVDMGIPAWKRNRILLVTMRDEPIWIVRHRIAEAVRVSKTTRRLLRLRYYVG